MASLVYSAAVVALYTATISVSCIPVPSFSTPRGLSLTQLGLRTGASRDSTIADSCSHDVPDPEMSIELNLPAMDPEVELGMDVGINSEQLRSDQPLGLGMMLNESEPPLCAKMNFTVLKVLELDKRGWFLSPVLG